MTGVNNRKPVEDDPIGWIHYDRKTKEVHRIRANLPIPDRVLLNGTSIKCPDCDQYVVFYPEGVAVETKGTCRRCEGSLFTTPWDSISPPVFCDNYKCSRFHEIVHPEDKLNSRAMKSRVKDMQYYLDYGHYPDDEEDE